MDDRKLKEYALKIFQGVSGYSLNKAFSLFPKYYPKIAYYYTLLLTKQSKELNERAIQALGLDKALSIKKTYEEINTKALTFYVNAIAKLNEAETKMQNAKDIHDKYNAYSEGLMTGLNVMNNSIDILADSTELLFKAMNESKIYGFGKLEIEINNAIKMNIQANRELKAINKQFSNYLKQYKYEEL